MSPIRRKFGLLWKGSRPSMADLDRIADAAITVLVCLAVLLLFGWLNARDAQIAAEIESNHTTLAFAHFLNGNAIVDQAGNFAAKCERLIEVTQ
jgi:hypothetical protein